MVTKALIGKRVSDGGEVVGILIDLDPKWVDPASPPWDRRAAPTAFVRPEGGGREWLVHPNRLNLA